MKARLGWLGGFVATIAVFAIVAPAAMATDYQPNKPQLNVNDVILNVQAQVAAQKATINQSGTAVSGDASSSGGTAVAGNGGNGGDAKAIVDNSSNAAGGSADTCKVSLCVAKRCPRDSSSRFASRP